MIIPGKIFFQRILLINAMIASTRGIKGDFSIYEIWRGKGYKVVEGETCLRICRNPADPRICEFDFKAEWWHTMTQDCLDCPENAEDCYNKKCITADGNSRLVQTINKQLPGPSIQVCEGDVIRVRVTNSLGHGTGLTIHWHGIQQRGTQFSDGIPYITQCYIDFRKTFVYEFVAEPAGSHYWHSHSGSELGDGLTGSLIVRKPLELEANGHLYDEDMPEHNIFFHTFRRALEIVAYNVLMTNFDASIFPVSVLFNGRNRRVEQGDGYFTPFTTYKVTQGKRYRFRIIFSGPTGCQLMFSIDQHPLLIIATELGPVEPFTVDVINLTPGQRFDFVVNANMPIAKYYMGLDGGVFLCSFISETARAILEYEGADPESGPTKLERNATREEKPVLLNSIDRSGNPQFDNILLTDMRMIGTTDEDDISGTPDKVLYYKLRSFHVEDAETEPFINSLASRGGNPTRALINHIGFKDPPRPLWSLDDQEMSDYSCNAESLSSAKINCSLVYCECTHLYRIPLGSLVEVHFITTYGGVIIHPMHLHGNSFYLLGMGHFEDEEISLEEYKIMDQAGKFPRNFEKVPEFDTISPPNSGYAIIRFRANNPGWWMFHCHLEFHIEWGMLTVLVVGDEKTLPKPPENYPICGPWEN